MEYRREIDGLRGIAVLSVLCFHMGITAFSGGFVGVDVFFVISGFLITKIIRDEVAQTGEFDFKNFYLRRVRRLFPALAFTLLLSLVAALFFFSPDFLSRFGLSLAASLFSVSNFYFWRTNDYFAPGAELEPLLHTWSLSVEEQFYLLWPVVLVFLLKRSALFLPVLALTAIFFLSLLCNHYFDDQRELIFYLLPFRVFELSLGGLMVWLIKVQPARPIITEVIGLTGLGMIAYAVFSFNSSMVFPSFNALIPCLGAAMVIYAGKNTVSGALLNTRWLVAVGLISYSLYLIHWPLIVFYKYYKDVDTLWGGEILALTVAALLMAWFMYRHIEQPFRHKRTHVHKNAAFIKYVVLIAALMSTTSIYAYTDHGMPWRLADQKTFINSTYGGGEYPWETYLGAHDAKKKIILYGDSHSKQYLSALEDLSKETGMGIHYLGHPACLALPQLTNIYKGEVHQSCIAMLDKLRSLAKGNDMPVIIAYRYTKTITDLISGERLNYKDDEVAYTASLIAGLERLRAELGENRKLVIFGGVPGANLKRGYLDCISRPLTSMTCHDRYPPGQAEFASFNRALRKLADRHANVLFLDPHEALCDENDCYVVRDGSLYYSDHAHLTIDGASLVVSTFKESLESLDNHQSDRH